MDTHDLDPSQFIADNFLIGMIAGTHKQKTTALKRRFYASLLPKAEISGRVGIVGAVTKSPSISAISLFAITGRGKYLNRSADIAKVKRAVGSPWSLEIFSKLV